MKHYVIGIDFGTLSGRCVVVDARTGEEKAESVLFYAHAVMDDTLPSGEALPTAFALQHPADYLDVLRVTVRDAMQKANVAPSEIAGVGMDFTACTLLPVDKSNTPLCFLEKYKNEKKIDSLKVLEIGANSQKNLGKFLTNDEIFYSDLEIPEEFQGDDHFLKLNACDMQGVEDDYFDIVLIILI